MTALLPISPLRIYDNSGTLAVGAKVYSYVAGTSTPQPTYTDSTQSTPNANPTIANSRGEVTLWLGTGLNYKLAAYDSADNLLWTVDQVVGGDYYNIVLSTSLSSYTDATKGAAQIGFAPLLNYAARTIGRSLADREWDCRDYPWLAKFDGVTDDTAAIIACITAVYAAGGGTVLLPKGTAMVSSVAFQWAAEKSIVIRGQGMEATILKKIPGTTTPVMRLTGGVVPLVVNSMLRDFTILGDGTRTHNGLQAESLALLHTENVKIQTCDVGYECLGSLIASHVNPYWVDNNIGVRLRKQGAVYANLLEFKGGEIGSNLTLGMDLGQCTGIAVRDTEFNSNGTGVVSTTGAIRIRDTVDDETGFSRISLDNVWLENNFGRPFVVEDAGALYLSVKNCTFTGGGAYACYIGAIGTFLWENCEAASPGASDTLTIAANRTVLLGGIAYQITDTSTYKTRIGFRTSAQIYDNYTERLTMGGNLYTTASLVYITLGGGPTYTSSSYTEGDHVAGFNDRENLGNLNAFLTTNGVPGSSTVCALRVGASRVSGGTGRGINVGGTVNTLGADYAEYETKRTDCGELAKGAIVGFDVDGLLTDKWSLAKTFGIKSTSPSFVGGDTWAAGLLPDPATGRLSDADAIELEARRQRVDRIAYSGKVPANITAAVGDYVIPEEGPGDTITATGVSAPTLEQYLTAIGQVRSIGTDGRPVIALKVS